MHKNLKTAFGERLKEIRKAKGFTQERLAEVLDISQRQLTRIETGYNFPSVETLERISLYLETDLKDLFDFMWDKEYAVLSTGTNDRPVFEVSVNEDVINISDRYKKYAKLSSKPDEDYLNIENSDKSMLKSAKNINKPITVIYKNPDGELSHIKTYYPDGTIEVAMSKEQVEADKIRKEIKKNLDELGDDINKLNYIKLASESLDSREKLETLKSLIKGIEIILGSK